jgi:hypothetical protein
MSEFAAARPRSPWNAHDSAAAGGPAAVEPQLPGRYPAPPGQQATTAQTARSTVAADPDPVMPIRRLTGIARPRQLSMQAGRCDYWRPNDVP